MKINPLIRWAIQQLGGKNGRAIVAKLEAISPTEVAIVTVLLRTKGGDTGNKIADALDLLTN